VRRLFLRIGFVARPVRDRYHESIVPLGGGVAIFATIAIFMLGSMSVVKFLVLPGYLDWLGEAVTIHTAGFIGKMSQLAIVLVCAAVLFLTGLWDDKKHLGPFFKLFVQLVVAMAAAGLADIRVELFIQNKVITTILSALWIVFIINAFNFLDNMDGLAAGIAAIATAILFSAAASSGQVFVGGLGLVFIGTLAGFLVFNFPPARIFMGDAGSLVVGFFVAILTLRTTYYHQAQSGQWYAVFMPLIVMAVPFYDFMSVTILRISQGKSPFVGDTQHFSHRLKRRGLSDRQTVLTLYLATLCTGAGAVILGQVGRLGAVLIFLQTFMILAIIAVLETTGRNDRTCN
jgi:UDP-GlcNAc:undecaprenyl-phosphate GlcNAc-1-phosphate transferase